MTTRRMVFVCAAPLPAAAALWLLLPPYPAANAVAGLVWGLGFGVTCGFLWALIFAR
jgi:hypothetical protein